jgi:hypothetical protein
MLFGALLLWPDQQEIENNHDENDWQQAKSAFCKAT